MHPIRAVPPAVAPRRPPPTAHRPPPTAHRLQSDMPDLSTYRAEFPILSRSVYMISNSLGAMPRGVAASLADYADTWATRGVRAWAERWWTMAREVGDAIGRIIGAPAGSVSMHENVTTGACGRAVVPARAGTPAAHRVLRGRFPVDDLPAARAGGARVRADDRSRRGGLHRRRGKGRRRHRRDDGARRDLARALPQLVHPGSAPDRRARTRRRRAGGARHVSVRGHHPGRRHGARRRLRRRRLPEVAVRRPGQRVPLHAAGPAAHGAAAVHRLVLAPRAVRVRHRCVRAAARMRGG